MYISYTCIINPILYINIYIYIYMTYNLHRKFTITRYFQNKRAPGEKMKIKK